MKLVATKMVAKRGVKVIWWLHEEAAAAARSGKPGVGDALLDLADAAERVVSRDSGF